MSPMEYLRHGEEEWQDVFERLCERFPEFGAGKVAGILRENNGHAGQAAAALRDLQGSGKREVDPDDQEHVKTLLTSPAMFSHVCKENFRKFDTNGDGVLSWSEVLPLVNTLYEGFGLQPPREGNLRTFFDANDVNKDGVLSEKEFKKFFECFLRYAFFDVVHKDMRMPVQVSEEPAPEPQQEARPKPERHERQEREKHSSKQRHQAEDGYDRSQKRSSEASATSTDGGSSSSSSMRVLAPHGISLRNTPSHDDRMKAAVAQGDVVNVLEYWVKTDKGWLPVYDTRGNTLLEPLQGDLDAERRVRVDRGAAGGATAPSRRDKKSRAPDEAQLQASRGAVHEAGESGVLRRGEEDWGERFERLQERFPQLSAGQVLKVLRAHQGHAGHTASALRELLPRG
eukprot:TRINITY_DN27582_c0_g2_i1.p1 TRINITY_DN27582_c0_g2~~TRINITY_DN27582_c0_g2_i1.p1  ORF type:complete len:399 (+),score=115.87 TRINITY_DN27582_c0_g2_i1:85-1281(+)